MNIKFRIMNEITIQTRACDDDDDDDVDVDDMMMDYK